MMVMPRPTARRAPSSTTRTVSTPTQTSMSRGKIWLAIVSMLTGSHAPHQHGAGDQGAVDDPAEHAARPGPAPDGIDQETQDEDEAEVNGPLVEQAKRLHARRVKLEQRQRDADHGDRAQHDPGLWRLVPRDLGIDDHQFSCPVNSRRTRSREAACDRDTTVSPTLSR